jgi:hypothetical protein
MIRPSFVKRTPEVVPSHSGGAPWAEGAVRCEPRCQLSTYGWGEWHRRREHHHRQIRNQISGRPLVHMEEGAAVPERCCNARGFGFRSRRPIALKENPRSRCRWVFVRSISGLHLARPGRVAKWCGGARAAKALWAAGLRRENSGNAPDVPSSCLPQPVIPEPRWRRLAGRGRVPRACATTLRRAC